MDLSEALAFLRSHQPLPSDEDLTSALCQELDRVRMYLADHPAPEALPLLLGVFGGKDGCGVYQMIEDTIARYPASDVVTALVTALTSGAASTRYWNAQIAMGYPVAELLGPLRALLPGADEDLRWAVTTALELNTSHES